MYDYRYLYKGLQRMLVQFSIFHNAVSRNLPAVKKSLSPAISSLTETRLVLSTRKKLPRIQTSVLVKTGRIVKLLRATNSNVSSLASKITKSPKFVRICGAIGSFDRRYVGLAKHLEPRVDYLKVYLHSIFKMFENQVLKPLKPVEPWSEKILKMDEAELLAFKRGLRIHVVKHSEHHKPVILDDTQEKTFILGKSPEEIVPSRPITSFPVVDQKLAVKNETTGESARVSSSLGSRVSSVGSRVSSVGSTVSSVGSSVANSVSSVAESVTTGLSGWRNISLPASISIPFSNKSGSEISTGSPPPVATAMPRLPKKLVPKRNRSASWPKPLYTKATVDEVTRHLVGSLHLSTGEPQVVQQLEMLCKHLQSFPWAKNLAGREQARGHILSIQSRYPSGEVSLLCREALSRLGHPRPLSGPGIRVLSIDGGGMRGLVALEIVKKLERSTGRRVYEMFDVICGVSTGAILAAFFGFHKMSSGEVSEIYQTIGRKVFSQNVLTGARSWIMQHAYYDAKIYETILKSFVGSDTLLDSRRTANTPAVAIISTLVSEHRIEPFVFRNYEFPPRVQTSFRGTNSAQIWESVRASSTAPGYFPDFVLDGAVHQDGGVMVNNPTQMAIREAQNLWPTDRLQCVVSLGMGRYEPNNWERGAEETPGQLSLAQKFSRFVDSATDTELNHRTLQGLLPGDVYFRFNPHLSEHIELDETRPEKMAAMMEDSQMYIRRNERKLEAASKALVKEATTGQKLRRSAVDWRDRGLAAATPHPAIRYFLSFR